MLALLKRPFAKKPVVKPNTPVDVQFVVCPYGYSYAVPFQIGYLKSSLAQIGIESRCYDLNIDFYEYFKIKKLDLQTNAKRYEDKAKFVDVTYWNDTKRFYDSLFEELKPLISHYADRLLEAQPKVIGFSIFNTNRDFSLELAKELKSRKPELKIIFGGPDCTSHFNNSFSTLYDEIVLKKYVDIVVIGEAESTIKELVAKILKGENLEDVKGILYTRENNQAHFTGNREFIEDINSIAYPDYSDFDFSKYINPAVPLVFNRGCNFRCVFCDIKLLWKDSFRKRTAENIAKEILYVSKLSNYPYAFFNGAYVNTSRRIMNELADILIEEWGGRPKLKWAGWGHFSKNLDEDTCKKLGKAGCDRIVFGFESGSPKVVKDMKKGYTHDIAEDNIKNLAKAGVNVTLFSIVGFPTETEEDFQMTLDFIERNAKYIDAAYCMSEFILSDQMITQGANYGIDGVTPHSYEWVSSDGENTLDVRKQRLQRFYKHLSHHGIKHT